MDSYNSIVQVPGPVGAICPKKTEHVFSFTVCRWDGRLLARKLHWHCFVKSASTIFRFGFLLSNPLLLLEFLITDGKLLM